MKNVYLAADFGGGSGRVIAGWIEDGCLVMDEVHRFGNRQVRLGDHIFWDFPALFEDMKAGLKAAASKGYKVRSIGVDSWGVDFGAAVVFGFAGSGTLGCGCCTSSTGCVG